MAEPPYQPTWALARAANRPPRRILKDLKAGRIKAERPGHEYLFTPEQFKLALQYYRDQPGGEHGTQGDDRG